MNQIEQFNIKNKLLKALIGLEDNINRKKVYGFRSKKSCATTVLTFLVKKVFSIHRLPMWEDRHFTKEFNIVPKEFVANLDDIMDEQFLNNIDSLEDEIKKLYKFTQKSLDIYYPNQNTIPLIRNLNDSYAVILLKMKEEAIKNGKDYIEIGTDILNSFTDINTYGMIANIKINIPKKDILYYYDILNDLMEPHEFIVINTRMDGLFKIPIECIYKTHQQFNIYSEEFYNISTKEYGTKYNFINFSSNTNLYFLDENNSQIQYNLIQKILLKSIKIFYKLLYRNYIK